MQIPQHLIKGNVYHHAVHAECLHNIYFILLSKETLTNRQKTLIHAMCVCDFFSYAIIFFLSTNIVRHSY